MPSVRVLAPEDDAVHDPAAAPLIDGWILRPHLGRGSVMRVLIISHGHPDYSIGGAEVASHALFRAIEATPGHEAFYLSRAPAKIRRHVATPLMSLRHGAREAFLHTGAWDEFWLSNDGTTELAGAFASYLHRTNPDVVHFHHVIGFGMESIALVRRVLPRARLVITFHEYLAICANHGQMVKTGRNALCTGASPALCNVCLPQHSPADFFAREEHLRAHLLLADAYVSPSHFLVDRYVAWGLPLERFRMIENGVDGAPVPARALTGSTRRDRFRILRPSDRIQGLVRSARRDQRACRTNYGALPRSASLAAT